MGPLGTEGIFIKAAEATLSALKENSTALLTILSAIVADPLYKWSITSFENRHDLVPNNTDSIVSCRRSSNGSIRTNSKTTVASKSCASTSGEGISAVNDNDSNSSTGINTSNNEAAAHAIRKINEKLQGYEDGTSGEQQEVQGQISFLVNSARDRDSLCVMFPGWAPWI